MEDKKRNVLDSSDKKTSEYLPESPPLLGLLSSPPPGAWLVARPIQSMTVFIKRSGGSGEV